MSPIEDSPEATSPPPPKVRPIEHSGVRYMEEMNSDHFGGYQSGGYLAATDIQSGERLGTLKVYSIPQQDGAGVTTPGCFFTSLKKVPGREQLEKKKQAGGRNRVDLASRSAQWMSGPQFKTP